MKGDFNMLNISEMTEKILDQDKKDSYEAMGLVFNFIDDLLHAGEFVEVDQFLEQFKTEFASTELLISILTTTIFARQKLDFRAEFFKKVEQLTHERGEWEEALLRGLE